LRPPGLRDLDGKVAVAARGPAKQRYVSDGQDLRRRHSAIVLIARHHGTHVEVHVASKVSSAAFPKRRGRDRAKDVPRLLTFLDEAGLDESQREWLHITCNTAAH
jgi:hypothetical protein